MEVVYIIVLFDHLSFYEEFEVVYGSKRVEEEIRL